MAEAHAILERLSYHAAFDASIPEAIRWARTHGFHGIQVALESPHLAFERFTENEVEAIAAARARSGAFLALHAPDEAASLCQTSPALLAGVFAYFEALFDFAERVGASLVTVHAGRPPAFAWAADPTMRTPPVDEPLLRSALAGNLDRLADLAAGRVVLCVENYGWTPVLLEVLAPRLGEGGLSLCWDLPKTYDGALELNEEHERFLLDHLPHVAQVHLHDAGGGRSHLRIGDGELDLDRHLRILGGAEVQDFCLEIRPREAALESLRALPTLLA